MKTLLLLRHAKSDWDHPDLDDHDRPLNRRGLRNAPLMGEFIARSDFTPAACLTSTAVRARHTAWLAITAMKTDVPITEIPGLYDFGDGEAIERAIALHGGNAATLMVVAHNPCTQAFALHTCKNGNRQALTAMRDKYPTCALARIDYDMTAWSALPRTKGSLQAFTTPKSLL